MNSYTAIGRLTKDPELRALPDGTPVCEITIAVKGLARGDQKAGYIDVISFGGGGEAAALALRKGWLVAVNGRLQYRDWETQEGAKRRSWEVIGNIEFLTAPLGESSKTSDPEPAAAAA